MQKAYSSSHTQISKQILKLAAFLYVCLPYYLPLIRSESDSSIDEKITEIEASIIEFTDESNHFYSEDFSNLNGPFLSNGNKLKGTIFWFEGAESGATAEIRNGHLQINANKKSQAGTIWLDIEFSGNLQIEFDVHIIDSVNNSNNMNFFLCFSSRSKTGLYLTRKSRLDGEYNQYHGGHDPSADLTGYILTHLANGSPDSPRYRLRDVPTFDPYLVEENGIGTAKSGQTYSVKIVKRGDRIHYYVDNKLVFNYLDTTKNPPHKKGVIGFRTWQTKIWWDNIRVIADGNNQGN